MIELSIIIISYNTRKLTLACLKSIFEETTGINYEVIVLDNNSSDGSVESITKEFPNIKLIANNENVGFAEGNNIAALNALGEYILLLNPDTLILDHAIERLFTFAKSWKHEGIFGGRTYLGDGTFDPTSCWKKPSLWSIFCFASGLTSIFKRNKFLDPESYGKWQRDSIKNVDIVTGCFLLLKSDIWRRLNGFSPDFFMYAEEADLCLRALNIGVQPIIYPDAKIIHYGGASESIVSDKMVRMLKAKIILISKHWNNKSSILLGKYLYLIGAFVRAWHPVSIISPSEKVLGWREVWYRREEWAI